MDIGRNTIDIDRNTIDIGRNTIDIGRNTIDIDKNTMDIGRNTIDIGTDTINIGSERSFQYATVKRRLSKGCYFLVFPWKPREAHWLILETNQVRFSLAGLG